MSIDIDVLNTSHGLAAHSAARLQLISQNIANADTPGYRALDIADFDEEFASSSQKSRLRATRASHLDPARSLPDLPIVESKSGNAFQPNGNNVSLEEEMVKSLELRDNYNLALGVFSKSMQILRHSLGRN